MICLQQPPDLVPHVVQAGISHIAGGNDFVAVQPCIVLQTANEQDPEYLPVTIDPADQAVILQHVRPKRLWVKMVVTP